MNDESSPEGALEETAEVSAHRAAPTHPAYAAATEPASAESIRQYGYVDFTDESWWGAPDLKVRFDIAADGLTVLIYARRSTGKTLVAVDIVYGLIIRGEVFGEPVELQPVFYVDRENGARQFRKRLTTFHGGEFEPLDRKRLAENLRYSALGAWKAFNTEVGANALISEVTAFFGERPGVVVIDSLSKVVAGKENDSDTFSQLHAWCVSQLKARGHIVIQLDNSGKDATLGARGSSAKEDNVDVVWELTTVGPEGSPTHRVLRCTKDREGLFGGDGAKVTLEVRHQPLLHLKTSGVPAVAAKADADEAQVQTYIERLDDLGVPASAGSPAARKALQAAGLPSTNKILARAVRRRKESAALPPHEDLSAIAAGIGGEAS